MPARLTICTSQNILPARSMVLFSQRSSRALFRSIPPTVPVLIARAWVASWRSTLSCSSLTPTSPSWKVPLLFPNGADLRRRAAITGRAWKLLLIFMISTCASLYVACHRINWILFFMAHVVRKFPLHIKALKDMNTSSTASLKASLAT